MLIWPNHPAFTTPLSALKGVGPKTLARLNDEGFYAAGDLLSHCPRFYQDRRRAKTLAELAPDEEALVFATVVSARAKYSPRTRRRYQEAVLTDENGERLTLTWFNLPPHYLKSLAKGRRLRLFGEVKQTERGWTMIHPDMEFMDLEAEEAVANAPEIRPVYAPIGDITSGRVKKLADQALLLLRDCESPFPSRWLDKNSLPDPISSLLTLHSPPGQVAGRLPRPHETRAFKNLALFELFFWQLMMLSARAGDESYGPRTGAEKGREAAENFWRSLPFEASPEQKRVCLELMDDLRSERPMSRLLQGEVGGGKTAVAGAVVFHALGRGGQAALMAPTEILARQHYEFLKKAAQALGFECALLTGALSEKEKKEIRARLADGRIHLVVGSQALLSPATLFKNLTLAVIDEQQRFGVRQRLSLRRKNARVDILAMSATPIPRSLALLLYGDLDVSRLSGLLPGRSPAETELLEAGDFLGAYRRFLELIGESGQGFLASPRIEGDEAGEGGEKSRSLADICRDMRNLAGPDVSIACLHGKMAPDERAKIMEDFRLGGRKILVATSIIEVGVDVPAASVILIEGAERFGLAQLHQLRGRVGRGGQKSYCLLLPSKFSPAVSARLRPLAELSDGHRLAELDLELRGPGEELGLKQSGWPAMTLASLPRDLPLLALARSLAGEAWRGIQGGDEEWRGFMEKLNFEAATERLMVTAAEAV